MKPETGIVIGKTGFPVIKYFKFKCFDPCLKFEEGAMPNLRKLKLAFNACNAGQQNTIPVGINYLSELKEVSAKIGGAGPEESHTRAAKSALRDAIRMHDRTQRVNIQCVKQIIFGNDDQSNITPVEDWPRSGEETRHFQNESKQRKEEEGREAVDVSASSHGAMGLYELSDGGCGSNSEDSCRGVTRSSIRSAHFGSSPLVMAKKKIVLKLDLQDKDKKIVLKAISTLHGIDSVSVDMKDSKLTVVGMVDPVDVVAKLRKVRYASAAIVSVGPAKDDKEGEKKEGEKDDKEGEKKGHFGPPWRGHPYPPHYVVHSAEEDPSSCVIC